MGKSSSIRAWNEKLIRYMHAFVWRYHLPVEVDLKKELCKLK